jgi:hypothetical protein
MHWTRNKSKNQKTNQQQWLRLKNASAPEIISQGQGKKTVVGKYSEAERHNPSLSAKSKADKKSGDDDIDRTGIKHIMKAAAAVASLLGPSNRKVAAAATDPLKKTKVKKPGPRNDNQTFWKRFTELCQYKVDHGTMRVPRKKDNTDNILANWIRYTRKRIAKQLLPAIYKKSLNGIECEWIARRITKKALMAGLPSFWSSRTYIVPSKFCATTKKSPSLAYRSKYVKRTTITVLTNRRKNAEFTVPRCKMIVEIVLVPIEFYLYGEQESDEQQEGDKECHQPPVPDADENITVEEDLDDVDDGNKKLASISMEDVFDPVFSQGSIPDNRGIAAQSTTATTVNVAPSITATNVNVAQSTTVATSNVTYSTTRFDQSNSQLAAAIASHQVIQTSCPVLYPILYA